MSKIIYTFILLCLCMTCKIAAQEHGFTATWSEPKSVEGFEGPGGPLINPGKEGNPGGFLKATHSGGANVTIKPALLLKGDWGKMFGNQPGTVSFDIKALDGYKIPTIIFYLSDGSSEFRYTITTQDKLEHPQSLADGWVSYSIPWQATWDNSEAQAARWVGNNQAASWAKVVANPKDSRLEVLGVTGQGRDDQNVGIDNFRVQAGRPLDADTLAMLKEAIFKPLAQQQEPVAHYTFEEGSGDVLIDYSEYGNHGVIHGASWVRDGAGWALEFDGVDDYVDCGNHRSLNPGSALTMEAWVYAIDFLPTIDTEISIMGKGYNFAITKLRDDAWAYIMGGQIGHRVNASLPFEKWVHLAQVYDGTYMRMYIDGRMVGAAKPQTAIPAGLRFRLASTDGKACFRGKMTSVRLYNRALTEQQLNQNIRSTRITRTAIASAVPVGAFGQIWVQIDASRLGVPLKNTSVKIDVFSANAPAKAKPATTELVTKFDHLGKAVAKLDASSLPGGDYIVKTTAIDAAGNQVGLVSSTKVTWAGGNLFPQGPSNARRLNNFVTELLTVKGPDGSGKEHAFTNPRTGWVFISNLQSDQVTLTAQPNGDTQTLTLSQDYDQAYETMRFLASGRYTIKASKTDHLIVRAVGQTIHATANIEPEVKEFGPYGGAFEEKYIFPHVNTLEIISYDVDKPFVKRWRDKGRMILPHLSYNINPKEGQSKEDAAYEKLINQAGYSHPLCDGNACDEFGSPNDTSATWGKAIARANAQSRYANRAFYAYSYRPFLHLGDKQGRQLVDAVKRSNGAYLWEAYIKDQRTEIGAWQHLNNIFAKRAAAYSKQYPGCLSNMVVCSYVMLSAPNESTMTLSSVNLKTFMDMQFNMVANHPVFEGVRGMLTYRSNYAEEETLRWAARLFRHYCIEGNTKMLRRDSYVLDHIRNPAFEQQDRGWQVKPAQSDGIKFDVIPGLSWLAMGYPPTAEGDTALITKRSDKAPNTISQTIDHLQPGGLYALRMITADLNELRKGRSTKTHHAVNITIDGASMMPEQSLSVIYPSCYAHIYGGFNRAKPLWLNYFVRVFKAESQTAKLTISDWLEPTKAGGEAGQELAYTFLKVQPYLPR